MFNSKNKIIKMHEGTIKDQKAIIGKKNTENIILKKCIQKVAEEIEEAEIKKIPFAIVVSNIKELVEHTSKITTNS